MYSLINNVKKAVFAKAVRRELAVSTVGALALAGLPAHAAGEFSFDTTAVVATITGGVTTVSAIGIAVISLVVVIKLFKWVQRVL